MLQIILYILLAIIWLIGCFIVGNSFRNYVKEQEIIQDTTISKKEYFLFFTVGIICILLSWIFLFATRLSFMIINKTYKFWNNGRRK